MAALREHIMHASAAYCDAESLKSWECKQCQTHFLSSFIVNDVIVDEPHQLQAYVGYSDHTDSILVVFRGTQANSLTNWVQDLRFMTADYGERPSRSPSPSLPSSGRRSDPRPMSRSPRPQTSPSPWSLAAGSTLSCMPASTLASTGRITSLR